MVDISFLVHSDARRMYCNKETIDEMEIFDWKILIFESLFISCSSLSTSHLDEKVWEQFETFCGSAKLKILQSVPHEGRSILQEAQASL